LGVGQTTTHIGRRASSRNAHQTIPLLESMPIQVITTGLFQILKTF
jgi:hypothetical protein